MQNFYMLNLVVHIVTTGHKWLSTGQNGITGASGLEPQGIQRLLSKYFEKIISRITSLL